MDITNSQIASNESQITGSQVVGDNNEHIKNNISFSWKFYVLVGASSFVGGVLASIIANLIMLLFR